MKNILITFLIPLFLATVACNHKSKPTGSSSTEVMPKCLQQMIDDQKKENPASLPLTITEYELNGKKVFLIGADCCDQFDMLYSSDCQMICAPTGGFEGSGDGKCPNFFKEAREIKVVWKK